MSIFCLSFPMVIMRWKSWCGHNPAGTRLPHSSRFFPVGSPWVWGSAAVVPQNPSKLQVQEWLSPGSPSQVGTAFSGHCRGTAPPVTCFSPAFQKHPGVSRCPWHKRKCRWGWMNHFGAGNCLGLCGWAGPLQAAQGAVFAEHRELQCWARCCGEPQGVRSWESPMPRAGHFVCALELLTPLPLWGSSVRHQPKWEGSLVGSLFSACFWVLGLWFT